MHTFITLTAMLTAVLTCIISLSVVNAQQITPKPNTLAKRIGPITATAEEWTAVCSVTGSYTSCFIYGYGRYGESKTPFIEPRTEKARVTVTASCPECSDSVSPTPAISQAAPALSQAAAALSQLYTAIFPTPPPTKTQISASGAAAALSAATACLASLLESLQASTITANPSLPSQTPYPYGNSSGLDENTTAVAGNVSVTPSMTQPSKPWPSKSPPIDRGHEAGAARLYSSLLVVLMAAIVNAFLLS